MLYREVMKPEVLLSLLLGTVLSSVILGYPPLYYIYLVHEILFVLIFFWFISIFLVKNLRKPLEIITLFFLCLFVVLSPVNKVLAPDYESEFIDDPVAHVDYLVEEIGERPYMSENEKIAAAYIKDVLEEKGFPVVDDNVFVFVEGKREDAVIVCAHYDTVPGSPGADDNGSGVAVLLGLTIPENPEYTIVLAFFTGEEVGMVESRYFANEFDRRMVGVISVDTVGVGEDFHISSLKEGRVTSFFLSQVVYGLSDTGVPSIGPLYSDHVPFNKKGVRAVGLTRSTNRKYPHIHSELDVTVDNGKLVETGETVQEIVLHFSYSGDPYLFVYEAVVCAVIISGILAFAVENLMNRIKMLKE